MVFELLNSFSNNNAIESIFYRGLYKDQYLYKKEWFQKYYALPLPNFFDSRLVNFLDDLGSKIVYQYESTNNQIYHSFYHRIPKKKKGPLVVHAYDMIQELFYAMPKAAAFKKKSFEAADLIIAISQSTKNDLCRVYPVINPKKVMVAHLGVDEIFFRQQANGKKTGRPYMLYVGGREYAYKNFNLLLDTFISRKYFLDFDLVLVGGEKELKMDQKVKVENTTGKGSWLVQKFGDDQMLADLYAGASVFVYPSLYEGFGIPVLEAMAAGCPVVACNASSIPEVAGDCALLFDPKNPSGLAEHIEKIITDKNLTANLVEKGRSHARQFTWQAMAEKVYQVYVNLNDNYSL